MTSVTTTVHSAADATGSAAMLSSVSMEAALIAPTATLRLLHREANLLPPLAFNNLVRVLRRSADRPGSPAGRTRLSPHKAAPKKLLTGSFVCNEEPFRLPGRRTLG